MQADGNCLYRALAHQCLQSAQDALVDNCGAMTAYKVLRRKAADHIEAHRDDFVPFVVDTDSDESTEEQLRVYLDGIRGLEWGTQVEIQALAATLQVHIEVSDACMPACLARECLLALPLVMSHRRKVRKESCSVRYAS